MSEIDVIFEKYETEPVEIIKQLKSALKVILPGKFFIDVKLVKHKSISGLVYVCIALGPRKLLYDDSTIRRLYSHGEAYFMNSADDIDSIQAKGVSFFGEEKFFELFSRWGWNPFDISNGQYILRIHGYGYEQLNKNVRKFIYAFSILMND